MIDRKNISFEVIENDLWGRYARRCVPGLNSTLLSIFWWLRSTNHLKFTEWVMCTEKHVLVQKMFTNQLNVEWKHWLSSKENVLGTMISKKGHVTKTHLNSMTHIYTTFLNHFIWIAYLSIMNFSGFITETEMYIISNFMNKILIIQ